MIFVFLPLPRYRMSMERRRMQLMSQRVEWGDSPSPPALSKQVNWGSPSDPQSSQSGSDSRELSIETSTGDGEDDLGAHDAQPLAPVPDDLIMAGRETRKKRVMSSQDFLTCKDWTLDSLISKSNNFHRVPRVRWSETKHTARQIKRHEDANPGGVPLVVEGLHNHPGWLRDKFTPEWFVDHGPDTISVRNVHDRTDKDITLSDFIARTRAISPFKTPNEKERLYGKDVPCPPRWNQFLNSGVIPPYLAPDAPENLLNNLPEPIQPETLMCYIGVGDTFTPCHKDLCASSGHNLMCYTEKGGSSFWFMTATSSANAAAEFFQNKLNQVLDHEAHVITVEELAQAPFDIYIAEQKLGDLVLVPPRSMHQVVNNGGITIKTSWSRMTLDGLSLALQYELPLYRRVCRAEIYRVKATIYHTLLKTANTVSDLLCTQTDSRMAVASTSHQDMPTQLEALLRLLSLFDSILIEEYSPGANNMRQLADPEKSDEEIEQIACDFCGADIFLSFFECRSCVSGTRRADPGCGFHICPGCYVEGRTCACEVMSPVQCRYVDKLFKARARAVDLFNVCSELVHKRSDSVLTNQELRTDGRLGLFRAALAFRKRRLEMSKAGNLDESRRCTVRGKREHNHDTPFPWMLQCQKCHSGSCFAHMVWSSQLHSAEALLANEKDVTGAALHEAHLTSKIRFSSEIATLKREELGHVPDLRVQLAYLAATFSTCRPINPNSKLWKAGHYDLKAWEIGLPNRKITSEMRVGPPKRVAPRPASKRHKRFVLDCVLVTSVSSPAKPKVRAGKPGLTNERNEPLVSDRADGDDDIPMRKRPKSTHRPRGPPGIPHSSSLRPAAATARPSHSKSVVVDTFAVSDSEDERPLKRPRVNSKSAVDLRFQTRDPQPASSVADAFNTAYAQNSKAIPNTVVRRSPSSASASAPLPRRKPKQKTVPVSPAGPASSSSEGSNSPAAPPDLHLQDTLTTIMKTLTSVQETQAKQAAEVREMRRTYEGHAPDVISDSATAIERQSLSTETTVKVVADLVNGLVSALHPSLNPQLPAASSSSHHYQTQPIFVTQSRNWPSVPPSRGRGRGRGSGVVFGDHPYRSTASRDISPEDYHRSARQRQYGHHTAPFPSPARHADAPVSGPARGGYYEQRIWIPGPHAGQERREERREERVREYPSYTEERRESQEPTRKRRKFTRFSPPNSPDNPLELVLSRSSRSLASRISRFEGEETGSDESGTLTNANETTGALQLYHRPAPVGGKARNEAPSSSTSNEKFFRGLRRSRSPTPLDDQDWETRYAKDVDNT